MATNRRSVNGGLSSKDAKREFATTDKLGYTGALCQAFDSTLSNASRQKSNLGKHDAELTEVKKVVGPQYNVDSRD